MKLHECVCNPIAIRLLRALFFAALEHDGALITADFKARQYQADVIKL